MMMKKQTNKNLTQEEKAIAKIDKYESDRKIYNISTMIVSIVDVIFGVLSIFYTAMLATTVVASIASFFVVTNRYIQFIKVKKLLKSMRIAKGIGLAVAYSGVKKNKNRSEVMKKFLKNLKNNPKTIIFAFLCSLVMFFVGDIISFLFLKSLPEYVHILIGFGASLLTIAIIFILGWEDEKSAALRKAKKTLSTENYAKLLQMIDIWEQEQKEIEKVQKEKKELEAQYEREKLQMETLALQMKRFKETEAKYSSIQQSIEEFEKKSNKDSSNIIL